MAIIQPDGLFNGKRLRACSDIARLLWPYLFLSANGFGRMEIDYESIKRTVFVDFRKFPKPSEFFEILREYRENGLLFLYESDGRAWGQWECKEGSLPKFKTTKDRRSPEPPTEEYEKWKKTSLLQTQGLPNISEIFGKFPNSSEVSVKFPLGIGVGIGVGKESTLTSAKETPQAAALTQGRFVPPTPDEVREYAASIGYAIDAEKFCAYHGSKGWVVGRSPMKNWKMAVVTWRSNDNSTAVSLIGGKKSPGQLLIEKYEREEQEEANQNAN